MGNMILGLFLMALGTVLIAFSRLLAKCRDRLYSRWDGSFKTNTGVVYERQLLFVFAGATLLLFGLLHCFGLLSAISR